MIVSAVCYHVHIQQLLINKLGLIRNPYGLSVKRKNVRVIKPHLTFSRLTVSVNHTDSR
jgi:hypothetical protein